MERKQTRTITVGGLPIGGSADISVQSMTNTDTRDVEATLAQIARLEAAGCQLVRLAIPDQAAARALHSIRQRTSLPLVADIHFDYRLALESIAAGADKIRINPGNIGASERVRAVADACRAKKIPIRIGVNGGSLSCEILARYGGVTAEGLVASALEQMEALRRFDFEDICLSLKASDVRMTVAAYRLIREKTDAPLHLGVTETGLLYHGLVKSSVGIGALLLDGIGDTLRVSLSADPVEEIRAGIAILKAAGLRREGVELIACPTCGRCRIDVEAVAREVEEKLAGLKTPVKVAVMGCAVNGPGEAREADYGIAGGDGVGLLFCRGEIVGKYPQAALADALVAAVREGVSDV